MRTLVVEDDFTSRMLLQEMLSKYGPVHQAMNGREAMEAFQIALDEKRPYDLICLDIMMPEKDGQEVLLDIREKEHKMDVQQGNETKIVMITVLKDSKNVLTAFREQCDAYLVKPVDENVLVKILRNLELIPQHTSKDTN